MQVINTAALSVIITPMLAKQAYIGKVALLKEAELVHSWVHLQSVLAFIYVSLQTNIDTFIICLLKSSHVYHWRVLTVLHNVYKIVPRHHNYLFMTQFIENLEQPAN